VAVRRRIRRPWLLGFVLVLATLLVTFLVRVARDPTGPALTVTAADGRARTVRLADLRRMPSLTRAGSYQNQYGNWGGAGVYTGVLLVDLLGSMEDGDEVVVRGADGYEVALDRARVEGPDYPVVVAYAVDGITVPSWKDGFRLVVLPEDGGVSNAEYGAASAGSFWVTCIVRISLVSQDEAAPAPEPL
jgi:hypothetical protein